MDCPSCGAVNAESATFCSRCLNSFVAAEPAAGLYEAAVPTSAFDTGVGVWTQQPTANEVAWEPVVEVGETGSDVHTQADAYLNSMRSEAQSHSAVVTALTRPLPGSSLFGGAWASLRYAVVPVIFLLGIGVWVLSGGLTSMNAGKVARISVPAGTVSLGTVEEIVNGPMGPLSAERRRAYATRVFAVPMDPTAALEYYSAGAGAEALATGGWVGPTLERELLGGQHYQWTRVATFGYRAKEEQQLDMWLGEARLARDIEGVAVPAGHSVVRILCGGLGVERLEFPVK